MTDTWPQATSFADLHYGYRLGKSTIIKIVEQVCKVLWSKLKFTSMPEMTTEKWKEVEEGFKKYANFPNCIGAIDGKHIELIQPEHTGSLFYNYKTYFSSVLLAVCDANYCFVYVDVGSYGKTSDSAIFKNSEFFKRIVNNRLNIPNPKPISNIDRTPLPHVFVGDEAFGIMSNMMRPYGGTQLTHTKKVFNYRLSRARRYIECTFGIMSNKWRIFHRPIDVNIDFAESIIKACTVLHNYVRMRDGYRYEDTLYVSPLQSIHLENLARGSLCARTGREKFANYFVNEGKLQWQNNMI
ncbi:unnamed protein product [Parnassius mnemosyne]|uniref:DDE Tnp4 domain-containing protein n=1 Tax=Parnassius mnemosyne TaxID=213953 RepID=A0AAV1MBL3_9NEOP